MDVGRIIRSDLPTIFFNNYYFPACDDNFPYFSFPVGNGCNDNYSFLFSLTYKHNSIIIPAHMSANIKFLPESQVHVKRMMEATKYMLPLGNSLREHMINEPKFRQELNIRVFHKIPNLVSEMRKAKKN